MSSRVIHYLIAAEIANLKGFDNDRFIVGALLPDLSKHENKSYRRAHFGKEIKELGIKGINWLNFKHKYHDQMKKDLLYVGYYCHLIMDALWVSEIVEKHIRIYPFSERNSLYQKSYRDYLKLNYLLSKEYNLKFCLQKVEDINIDEIDLSLFDEFFNALKSELSCSAAADKDQLELYPYEEIIKYIENTIDFCLKEIQAFNEGRDLFDPEALYVRI